MAKILIITAELTPLPGAPVGGLGVRIDNLRDGLIKRGHTVIMSFFQNNIEFLEKKNIVIPADLKENAHSSDYEKLIKDVNPDVIIFSPWLYALNLIDSNILRDIPVVIDIPGFLSLENLFEKNVSSYNFLNKKLAALKKGDIFCVSNPRQKYYLYPLLYAAGLDLKKNPVIITPISNCSQCPERSEAYPERPVIIFSGILWAWQDYGSSLETISEYCDSEDGRFKIFCGGFMYKDEKRNLNYLSKYKNTELNGLTEYGILLEQYKKASVAVELYLPNVEREFATTTRTFEYLWSGLPVIYTKGMYLADYIKEYDAGWVIDSADKNQLQKVLAEIFADPQICSVKGRNAQRLLKEQFNNYDAVRELSEFCAAPRKLKNKITYISYLSKNFLKTKQKIKTLKNEITAKSSEIEIQRQDINKLKEETFRLTDENIFLKNDLERIKSRLVFRLLLKLKKVFEFIAGRKI